MSRLRDLRADASKRSPALPPRRRRVRTSQLLLGSLGLAAVAGLAFALTADVDYQVAVVLASLIGFAAATMGVVACVAFGVRVGLASDD